MGTDTTINEQMIKDREAGMKLKQIADKYGVSIGYVSKATSAVAAKKETDLSNKDHWPEWVLWRNLNKRYGRKR